MTAARLSCPPCLSRLLLPALAGLALAPQAWAGRPLSSDDAVVADAGSCQIEAWLERAGSDSALVLAPACGLADGLELDADYTQPRQRDRLRAAAGLALKWAPASWRSDTTAGALNFGLKLALAHERAPGAGWHSTQTSALALTSLQAGEAWALHANLGAARDRSSGSTAGLLNLALVWTPRPRVLLFAESQLNNRHGAFGGNVQGAGARWWLIQDRLGIDLTASRETGAGRPTLWSFGLGWYGLSI
jgi:hypothetical protein